MKITQTEDKELVKTIRELLKKNDGYCPCALERSPETQCMCKDFLENAIAGESCHCGLYIKVEA